MKVIFATTGRFPTERANGHCAVKTCEGLASAGAVVELWHSDLYETSECEDVVGLGNYGVRTPFAHRSVALLRPYFADSPAGPVLQRARYGVWGVRAARLARASGPDVCYTTESVVALAMTIAGVPVVYENHHPKRHVAGKEMLKRIARRHRNPGIVSLSDRLRAELIDYGVAAGKVRVIRHGHDPALFENLPGPAEARRELGLPGDRPIVGYVGRFQALGAEKGIEALVEAMARVQPVSGIPPLLVCVGGPLELEGRYRDLAHRKGCRQQDLHFVGHVESVEVPTWIRAFDVAAIPFPETAHFATVSPLKLVEYLAGGACVLATDLPSLREEVRHDESAWLVPGNPREIALAIDRLLGDDRLRRRLGTAAAEVAATRTWHARGEEILDFVGA